MGDGGGGGHEGGAEADMAARVGEARVAAVKNGGREDGGGEAGRGDGEVKVEMVTGRQGQGCWWRRVDVAVGDGGKGGSGDGRGGDGGGGEGGGDEGGVGGGTGRGLNSILHMGTQYSMGRGLRDQGTKTRKIWALGSPTVRDGDGPTGRGQRRRQAQRRKPVLEEAAC